MEREGNAQINFGDGVSNAYEKKTLDKTIKDNKQMEKNEQKKVDNHQMK